MRLFFVIGLVRMRLSSNVGLDENELQDENGWRL